MTSTAARHSSPAPLWRRLWSLVPLGGSLPEDVWRKRHRFLLGLTWFHAIIIALIGPALGYSWELSLEALFRDGTVLHTIGEGLIVALFAGLAIWRRGGREFQATAVGFGLMSASAIFVHLSGGYIEFHFHFFVMLVFLAFYQDWVPYLLAVLYVAIHHGVVGVLWPEEVYNHPAALNAPWTWAGIHAFFVLWSCVGSVIAWRFNETAFARTKLILDSAGEGVYGLDLDGKSTFVNPAAARMLGWEVRELIGRHMHDLLHHSRANGTPYPREECPIYAAFKDGAVHQVTEELFWRKDGTGFPVDYMSTPITERGQITGAVVTFKDVAERKRMEAARRAAEARFAGILDIAADGVISVDENQRIVLFNKGAEQIFGYSAKEILSQPLDLLLPSRFAAAHRRHIHAFAAASETAKRMGDRREVFGRRRDGTEFPAEASISKLTQDGKTIFTVILRDITERRRAEEKLQALNELARLITSSLSTHEVFGFVVSSAAKLLNAKMARLWIEDRASGGFTVHASYGVAPELLKQTTTVPVIRPGEGVLGEIIETRTPAYILDAREEPRWLNKQMVKALGLVSVAAVPIIMGDRVLGVLTMMTGDRREFTEEEKDLLKGLADQAAVAIKNARLFGETQSNLERIKALREIDQAITSTLDLRTVLDVLLEKIDLVLPYSATTVRLLNKESGAMEPVACRNLDEKEWKAERWRGGRGIPNVVFETKAPVTISNVQSDPQNRDQEFFRKHGLVSYLGVPLIVQDEVLGVISFYTKEEHEFTSEEVEFLSTLAGQAAIAIHNSQLYEEMTKVAGELAGTNRRLERSLGEISSLHTALTPLAPAESVHQMMDGIIERLVQATGADAALIRLWDRAAGTFVCASQRGFPDSYLEVARSIPLGPPGSALAQVFESGEPIISSDIAADSRFKGKAQLRAGLRACAFLPLKVRGEVRGIVHLSSREVGHFSEEQRDHLLAIARQMGIMMENRDLFDELRASRDKLERANKVKDEFLSVMSHELRTPLNVVMGYSGMIRDRLLGAINPEQERALEKVISRARDQLSMISSILQATQLEAEGVKVEAHELSLEEFLDDLKLNYTLASGKELNIVWDYPPDLPAINTDSEKLKHVLQNLINNAIKFTEKGTITVSARCLNGAGSGQRDLPHASGNGKDDLVEFKVADTGIGIAEEHFSVIFDRFQQVDSSETRRHGGVGIGLYIVKKFTEMLGGKIDVESEVGKGSTFTVTIPCQG